MEYIKILTLFLLIVFFGCSKEASEIGLEISTERVFNFDSGEHTLRIGVRSDSDWWFMGDPTWCKVNKISGEARDSLIFYIPINVSKEGRDISLRISNSEESVGVDIYQEGAAKEYHYQLPIVFHVLCYGEIVVDQVLENRLIEILGKVNAMFGNANGESVDMNLEFIPATHDPQGKPLERAGVNWIQHTQETMDPQDFEDNKYGDARWVWDPNRYVNVMIYSFSSPTIAGFSAYPFTPKFDALEGLPSNDWYYVELPDSYVPCLSLNISFMYKTTPTPLGDQEIAVFSLTHELGHYLGLFHAFSNSGEFESDYCDDTPDYDRGDYLFWKTMNGDKITWYDAVQRTDRDEKKFISTNIMDYVDGYLNRFTPDQRKRVRHVLERSPLIPGPKIPLEYSRDRGGRTFGRPIFSE